MAPREFRHDPVPARPAACNATPLISAGAVTLPAVAEAIRSAAVSALLPAIPDPDESEMEVYEGALGLAVTVSLAPAGCRSA
jgi:hypothetical protein